jgi:arylsulfatase A-like enzyme
LLVLLSALSPALATAADHRPNIVFILADDLGYGDVGVYNAESKIPTPNLDRMAAEGIRFTDAHSPDAVCSPTRYATLTGRYAWRTRLQRGALHPYDPPLIAPTMLTVPELLRRHGYATAAIGKWHLGFDWPTIDGATAAAGRDSMSNVDFTRPIGGGPITRGFDYFFGPDTPHAPPYVYIENDRAVGRPTALLGKQGDPAAGPAVAGWDMWEVLPELTRRATELVKASAAAKRPFFLYFALPSPHQPVAPATEFKGKSAAGDYGDFVAQTDWSVGQVLEALRGAGIEGDTLVFFTSDNGPENNFIVPAGFPPEVVEVGVYERIRRSGHAGMGPLRGAKRDLWEGGHRVPFLARWPGRIAAGAVSDQTICHVDLMATVAALLGYDLPDDAGVDSHDLLPALLGERTTQPIREATVHHSRAGRFAIRRGDWVLLLASSGDDSEDAGPTPRFVEPGDPWLGEPQWWKERRGYVPHDQPGELYDLRRDLAQRHNLYGERQDIVVELRALLQRYVADGRSTPGAKQSNDVAVALEPAGR